MHSLEQWPQQLPETHCNKSNKMYNSKGGCKTFPQKSEINLWNLWGQREKILLLLVILLI